MRCTSPRSETSEREDRRANSGEAGHARAEPGSFTRFDLRWLLAVSLLGGAASHADEAADLALGKRLFVNGATPACGLCHALKDAGTAGAVGPSLDDLKPDAERVKKAITGGIGQMPAFTTLSEREVQAIARYVERATGAAK